MITRLLLRFARPYSKGDLLHADGSLYMGRFTLFETRWISARIHHIASADFDRDMHDHPWWFLSVVLSGGYTEERPTSFHKPVWIGAEELRDGSRRGAGSLAFRHATDRHLISAVDPDTWTLFVYGPLRQWWGFYTRAGKVYWRDYPSVHEAARFLSSNPLPPECETVADPICTCGSDCTPGPFHRPGCPSRAMAAMQGPKA